MYDDMHDNMAMTTYNHGEGMNFFPSHLPDLVLHDGNFMPENILDANLIMDGTLPLDTDIRDDLHIELPEGNYEELLAYPDPLSHAGEFIPTPFELSDTQADIVHVPLEVQENMSSSAISYAMSVDGGLMPSWNDVNDFTGVENGMLSDSSQLNGLIAVGEVQGTMHVHAEDEVRSEEAIKNFLHEHGYTDVPAGYEVHHIVPLSQGGADDPHNMVLLTKEQHDTVTSAHRQYYGW